MKTRTAGWTLLAVVVLVTACRAVAGTVVLSTAVVVGTVGTAGHVVYKGGEAVVSGVGAVGSAVGGGSKSVVVSKGTFRTECNHPVEALQSAGKSVMERSGFTAIDGKWDFLAGELTGMTASGAPVQMKFELLEDVTSVQIRIGEGNLKQSEVLYGHILDTIEANKEDSAP